eukprot:g8382.t1
MNFASETEARRAGEPANTARMDEVEPANMNDGNADATNALEQKALVLEERSRSRLLAMSNESLQVRLDAALSEIESLKRSNEAVQAEAKAARCSVEATRPQEAGLLKAERTVAADACALHASPAMASIETEAAAAKATKARGLEVRRLEEKMTRLLEDAQERAFQAERQLAVHKEQAAKAAEESNTWAVRSKEWEAEAERLAEELEISQEKVVDLEKELEAAVAVARDQVASRREVERALRIELEVAQTAVRSLKSTSGETARYSAATLDDMRGSLETAQARLVEVKREKDAALQSLLEVAKMRTPHKRQQQHIEQQQQEDMDDERGNSLMGSSGVGVDGCDQNGDTTRWGLYPDFEAVYRHGEESRIGTQIPCDESSEGPMDKADLANGSSSPVGAPGKTPPRTPGGPTGQPSAGRRSNNDGGGARGDAGGRSHGETDERVCCVCGAPAPSFRKLFDCRLSLDRARAEASEARARELLNEEGAASENRKAQSAFAAIRERLEHRPAAERATRSRVDESRDTAARHTESEGSVRGRETATRRGEIAALRTRLRLTEEEVEAARREAVLEAQAKALREVEAVRMKAARAFAKAEALQDRCGEQEQTIASLTLSREKEVSSCRAAEGLLAEQRTALVVSEGRVRELELEVSSLAALLQAANTRAEKQSMASDKDTGGEAGSKLSACRNGGDDSRRFGDTNAPFQERSGHRMADGPAQAHASHEVTRESSLETNARERARFALEDSLHAARGEAEHLRRRIATLRAALMEAQHRCHQMEAAAASALAVADAERAAVATAKADTAKAIRREAEQNHTAAERRQREVVEALQAELSRATAGGFKAREELAVARGELERLRKAVKDSDRRATFLEGNLASSTTSLHEADAARFRVLVDRVLSQGRDEGEGLKEDEDSECTAAEDASKGRVHCDTVTSAGMLSMGEGTRPARGGADGQPTGFSLGDETATLRARLLASQAQHVELVRASGEALASCSRRCEVRIRVVAAAGKLAVACSRKRGIVAAFILLPATNTAASLDQRRASNAIARCGAAGSCWRKLCRRDERTSSRAPSLAQRATAPDSSDGPSQQQQPKQSARKKAKRPRKHVPVDDVELPPMGGGGVGAGLVGDPFADLVSPVEYAELDSQSGSSAERSASSARSSSLPLGASLPEPTYQDRQRFERIMEEVLEQEKPEELPAILTKHVDFLLSVDVTTMTNDLIRQEPTMERVNTLRNAYEFIVTFLESMVESTVDVQKENQTVLRLIIEAAKTSPEVFEKRMKKLQDRFTFEFVKYLDSEVERLEKVEKDLLEKRKNKTAPDKNDPFFGGNEVLNVIKIVRSRVCAQVDLMMGEDVAVLTRMLSYDDRFMMRAALRAVFRDKSPKEIAAFGVLVSSTLKDVVELGSGVDPVLRSKLVDMTDDIEAVGRDIEERQKDKREREAEQA